MGPSCSLAFGIACRAGKISGQHVMDIPAPFSNVANLLSSNAVLVEVFNQDTWLSPRSEPVGVSFTQLKKLRYEIRSFVHFNYRESRYSTVTVNDYVFYNSHNKVSLMQKSDSIHFTLHCTTAFFSYLHTIGIKWQRIFFNRYYALYLLLCI